VPTTNNSLRSNRYVQDDVDLAYLYLRRELGEDRSIGLGLLPVSLDTAGPGTVVAAASGRERKRSADDVSEKFKTLIDLLANEQERKADENINEVMSRLMDAHRFMSTLQNGDPVKLTIQASVNRLNRQLHDLESAYEGRG
jgi:hypothetical protein